MFHLYEVVQEVQVVVLQPVEWGVLVIGGTVVKECLNKREGVLLLDIGQKNPNTVVNVVDTVYDRI